MAPPAPSGWTTYPGQYKFISIAFYLSANSLLTQRETYSFLEYLGDISGLNDCLGLAFGLVVAKLNENRVA